MPPKSIYPILFFIFLTLFNVNVRAEQSSLNSFMPGSYQQILASNASHPFILVAWSINCSSCLKDMSLLSDIHKSRPELKIIMLATDDLSATDQIKNILEKNRLSSIESWVFADENTHKLRFEIDPKWYGEMPRTYFFDAAHQRTGVSGVLTKQDYEAMITKIIK